MLSMAETILAVALPLGLCMLLSIAIILWMAHRQRYNLQLEIKKIHAVCSEQQKQLEIQKISDQLHKVSITGGPKIIYADHVERAFVELACTINDYVVKWISYNLPSQFNESLSRIEALLFQEPYNIGHLSADKDVSIFRNPHNYTAAEIKANLEQDDGRVRRDMAGHLLMSIILPRVSLDGNPYETILPFSPSIVHGLDRVRTWIQGENFEALAIHISRFPAANALKLPKDHPERHALRKLFETLFEPYYLSQPDAMHFAKSYREKEFDALLDEAVKYGMSVLGLYNCATEIRWGDRVDGEILTRPALYASPRIMGKVMGPSVLVRDNIDEQKHLEELAARGDFGGLCESIT